MNHNKQWRLHILGLLLFTYIRTNNWYSHCYNHCIYQEYTIVPYFVYSSTLNSIFRTKSYRFAPLWHIWTNIGVLCTKTLFFAPVMVLVPVYVTFYSEPVTLFSTIVDRVRPNSTKVSRNVGTGTFYPGLTPKSVVLVPRLKGGRYCTLLNIGTRTTEHAVPWYCTFPFKRVSPQAHRVPNHNLVSYERY